VPLAADRDKRHINVEPMLGVANVRVPPEGWRPEGFDPAQVAARPLVTSADVSATNAIRTPQFWLLWTVLACNVTAGIGILEQASPMIQDFFRGAGGKSTVAVSAAAGFVGVLSLFNMAGRFVWSSTSDAVGRKPMYAVYLGGGIVLYTLLATIGKNATPVFVLLAGLILSFYGGGFATVPAYLRVRDLPGGRHPRPPADRLVAGRVAGPLIVNRFLDAQGKPGTLTASAYRPALFTMVGILALGFVANLLIRPVAERFDEPAGPAAEPALMTGKARADREGQSR
jgi:MFS family permease